MLVSEASGLCLSKKVGNSRPLSWIFGSEKILTALAGYKPEVKLIDSQVLN